MNVDNPAQILPSYRRGGGTGMKMGVSSQEIRGLVAAGPPPRVRDPYGPPFYPREPTESLGSGATSSQDPIYSDPLTKVGSVDSSLKEDHIYATLSETFGSMSSLSEGFLGDDQRCSSVTTVANDDFEFHDPRAATPPAPSHLPARDRALASARNLVLAGRPPAQLPPEALRDDADDAYGLSTSTASTASLSAASSSFRSASSQVTATIESSDRSDRNELAKVDDRRHDDDDDDDDEEDDDDERRDQDELGFYNTGYECDTLEKKRKAFFSERGALDTLGLRSGRDGDERNDGTLSRKHRSSSLSMNDLDRLDKDEKEEEMMFILPVKSESMLSLYRLYLAEDEAEGASLHYSVEISRSEGDLSLAAGVGPGGEGKSEGALHEVYQKRRAPEAGGSRVKLQHKIQRAKGLQQRARRPSAPPLAVSSSTVVGAGMQVAIMDKARRRNGIITIQDPSGLSVEELFRVLDRASGKKAVPYADVGDPASPEPPPPPQPDFKKIFVSEYL
ncbi:uncharacterized protein LOC122258059 [Penaeus japonicus]|uniref:uncharacterized protein LOC122258059 n=1 Tax=Penaeus japonicus TaxID=27405 RepID=UPI001C713616|nr:uncharacterized protein LOC122258059 [Penaeus japonicus]